MLGIVLFQLFALPFNVIYGINLPSSQQTNPSVLIYVNSTIYSSIQSEIDQYKNDIIDSGYNVKVINWSSIHPALKDRALELRQNLTDEYNANGIEGAVFVGEMPYALWLNGTVNPCDLFFMDLDGTWTDLNFDGIFESHVPGSGDLYPEIYIGRINPYCATILQPYTTTLNKYFTRNHNYRMNITTRYNTSLLFIDDDWESTSDEWLADMHKLYKSVTLINNSIMTTNSSNYKTEINNNYDFCQAFIHSDSFNHYFKPFGTDGTINYNEFLGLPAQPLFWNLYCCYAADFSQTDNLATYYLFSTSRSLAVFASTRAGGFQMNSYLYTPLNNSKTLGQAFKEWWYNDLYELQYPHGPQQGDAQGNCLLGDPFLKIKYGDEEVGGIQDDFRKYITYILIAGLISLPIIGIIIKSKKNKNQKE